MFSDSGIYYWSISFFDNVPFIFLRFPFLKFQIIRSKTSWIILLTYLLCAIASLCPFHCTFLGNTPDFRLEFVLIFLAITSLISKSSLSVLWQLFYIPPYSYPITRQCSSRANCICCRLQGFGVTRSSVWDHWVCPKEKFTIFSFRGYLQGHRNFQAKW